MKIFFSGVTAAAAALLAAFPGCDSPGPSEPPPLVSPLSPPGWIMGAWSYDTLSWVFSSDNALHIINTDTLDYKEMSKSDGLEISDDTLSDFYTIYLAGEHDSSSLNFSRTSDTTFRYIVAGNGYLPPPCTYTRQ